jgi:hypothetical protein
VHWNVGREPSPFDNAAKATTLGRRNLPRRTHLPKTVARTTGRSPPKEFFYMNEIEEAIKLLDAYRKRLDRSTKRCLLCTTVHKTNWKEYQRFEQVTGIIQKLSRWLVEAREENRRCTEH